MRHTSPYPTRCKDIPVDRRWIASTTEGAAVWLCSWACVQQYDTAEPAARIKPAHGDVEAMTCGHCTECGTLAVSVENCMLCGGDSCEPFNFAASRTGRQFAARWQTLTGSAVDDMTLRAAALLASDLPAESGGHLAGLLQGADAHIS